MNGINEPIKVNNIKKEPVDTFDQSSSHDDGSLKNYRHHLIGPFAVNESTSQEDREKFHQCDTARMSDSDALSVRIASRDGAESVTSHESEKMCNDDLGGELKYECNICCAKFRSARTFGGHKNAHRYSTESQTAAFLPCSPYSGQFSPKAEQTNGTFKCDGCQRAFYSRDTYAMHMMLRAKNENCSLNKSALSQLHVDLKEERNERVKMNIEAILSSLGHSNWNSMDVHKMSIRKALEYRSANQDSPRQQHSASDVLACSVCGEVMHSKDSLAMHMLFHARGDGTEEDKQSPLPIPPLVLPTMREYVNALTIVGNKVQAARNVAAFHQAAVNMTTDHFDSISRQVYEPLPSIPHTERNENESKRRRSRSSEEMDVSKDSDMAPIIAISAKHRIRNGFPDATNGTSPSDVDESRSDTWLDVGMTRDETVMDLTNKAEEERPKSLDSGIKTPTITNKKYHGKYKSYQQMKMRNLLRKYSRQKLQKRQQPRLQPQKIEEAVQIRPEELKPLLETNPKIPKELLAAHNTICYCQYCEIIYLDRTIYQLHMGLHNVNNPWQCNACGKICVNRLEFSSHVLHY